MKLGGKIINYLQHPRFAALFISVGYLVQFDMYIKYFMIDIILRAVSRQSESGINEIHTHKNNISLRSR